MKDKVYIVGIGSFLDPYTDADGNNCAALDNTADRDIRIVSKCVEDVVTRITPTLTDHEYIVEIKKLIELDTI